MDPKLADKLTRILALTNSPMEHEAQAATEMLAKLLLKHNLEIADLEAAGTAAAPTIGEHAVSAAMRADGKAEAKGNAWFGAWKLDLASALAEHFFCYAIRKDYARSVVFVGRPDNTESLQMLYNWLVTQISTLTPAERRAYAERTGENIHAVRWYKAFTAGAVQRIAERLRELKAQQAQDVGTSALVVHHMAEVSDYLESIGKYRVDGKLTKKQQEQQEEQRRRDAAWKELLVTDPEAAYRARPWERPLTPEQHAKQEKENAAWSKRHARRRRYMTGEEMERDLQSLCARHVGAIAAGTINLQPFVAAGKSAALIR